MDTCSSLVSEFLLTYLYWWQSCHWFWSSFVCPHLYSLGVYDRGRCYLLLILMAVHIFLQAKRKRARTPTPGEYLGVRGECLNTTASAWMLSVIWHESVQQSGFSFQLCLVFVAITQCFDTLSCHASPFSWLWRRLWRTKRRPRQLQWSSRRTTILPLSSRDGRDRERSPRHSPYRGYRRERSRSPRY